MPILEVRILDDGWPEVIVDRRVEPDEFEFAQRDPLWWAARDGQVEFFQRARRPGGEARRVRTGDGAWATLRGIEAASPGAARAAGFPPCMEAMMRAGSRTWFGHVLVAAVARRALVVRDPLAPNDPPWRLASHAIDRGGIRHLAVLPPFGWAPLCGGGQVVVSRAHPGRDPVTCLRCAARRGSKFGP